MRLRPFRGVLLVVAAVALGACSTDDPSALPLPSTSTGIVSEAPSETLEPSASASAQPSAPVLSADEQAVLDAYRAFWAALDLAQADPPRSQDHLAPVAVGAQFEQTNSAIKADFLAGEVSEGAPVLNPRVASIVGDTAVIQDCQDTRNAVRKDAETGEVLLIGLAEDSVESTLQRVEGTWKVAATTYPEPAGRFC